MLAVSAIAATALLDIPAAQDYSRRLWNSMKGSGRETMMVRYTLEGEIALIQKNYQDSIKSFEQALTLLPEHTNKSLYHGDVWFGLGLAKWNTDSRDEAAGWFRKVADGGSRRIMTPLDFVRSNYYLGKYYDARRDSVQAKRYYSEFLDFWGLGQVDKDKVREVTDRLAEMQD